jgi:hypothetical protein
MEEVSLRCVFPLLPDDAEYLDARGLAWETLIEEPSRWILIRKFPIPEGYNVSEADVAILLPNSYPTTQLDMAYVFPALSLTSGAHINNVDVIQVLDNRSFQRWSRHRTQANPWRPSLDNLGTHIELIEECFLRETKKNG